MKKATRSAVALLFLFAGLRVTAGAAEHASGAVPPATVYYSVRLSEPAQHIIHVTMQLARRDVRSGIASDGGESFKNLQLPVWNALYQVRDFSQYVMQVSAQDATGNPVPVRQLNKSEWEVSSATRVDYDIVADSAGPYGAQLSVDHAFLNLAQILMYPLDGRSLRVVISFEGVPKAWGIATTLAKGPGDFPSGVSFSAPNYDALVDAPVEMARFRELSFDENGAKYRIVIDADGSDYDATTIQNSVRRIVRAETEWMGEHPCSEYLFIYHFPRGFGGGGMEHACSTAIDVPAERLADDLGALEGVTAHEFFHLWNVKRIRPGTLEPVDYTKEQYTRALWFSEGVSSTVQEYFLLRAGMIGEKEYLRRLGFEINTLQNRAAHRTQSVEDSSLEAWFEKYPFYRRAERSISYYNKGEILGAMLDLAMRDATGGSKTLRDLFQWMNENYAKRVRFFNDSEGVREAVEAVTGKDFRQFFSDYVAGTQDIAYDRFLGTVGLRLTQGTILVADPGFNASRNFDGFPVVTDVTPGSAADRAGLRVGDMVVEINGQKNANIADEIGSMRTGDRLTLRVRGSGHDLRDFSFSMGSRQQPEYSIVEVEHPTKGQLGRRAEWLQVPREVTQKGTVGRQPGGEGTKAVHREAR